MIDNNYTNKPCEFPESLYRQVFNQGLEAAANLMDLHAHWFQSDTERDSAYEAQNCRLNARAIRQLKITDSVQNPNSDSKSEGNML